MFLNLDMFLKKINFFNKKTSSTTGYKIHSTTRSFNHRSRNNLLFFLKKN